MRLRREGGTKERGRDQGEREGPRRERGEWNETKERGRDQGERGRNGMRLRREGGTKKREGGME